MKTEGKIDSPRVNRQLKGTKLWSLWLSFGYLNTVWSRDQSRDPTCWACSQQKTSARLGELKFLFLQSSTVKLCKSNRVTRGYPRLPWWRLLITENFQFCSHDVAYSSCSYELHQGIVVVQVNRNRRQFLPSVW